MSANPSNDEIQAAIDRVRKRAMEDGDYRARLLAEPEAAVEDETGIQVPEGFVLNFVENKGADMTVVLPDPVESGEELSDEDLEQVAGGGRCAVSCAGSCGVTSTAGAGIPGVGGIGCV